MALTSDENLALILGFAAAAAVGAIVSVLLADYFRVPVATDAASEQGHDFMLHNHEEISFRRDMNDRLMGFTIDRIVE